MKSYIAIASLMGAVTLASPIAKAQFGTEHYACVQQNCNADIEAAKLGTCGNQNNAETVCVQKCFGYSPNWKFCNKKRQYGAPVKETDTPEGNTYGSGPEDSPNYGSQKDKEGNETEKSDEGVYGQSGQSYTPTTPDTPSAPNTSNTPTIPGISSTPTVPHTSTTPSAPATSNTPTSDENNNNNDDGGPDDNNTDGNEDESDNDDEGSYGNTPLIDVDTDVGSGPTSNGGNDSNDNNSNPSSDGGNNGNGGSLIDVDLDVGGNGEDDENDTEGSLIDADIGILNGGGSLIDADIGVLNGGGSSLIDADVDVLHGSNNGGGSLIDADVNVGGGSDVDSNGGSLIDADVNVGGGNGGSLIDIDVELRNLLDVQVDILGDNGQPDSDEDRQHLIEIDAKILNLLDLHVGVLRRGVEMRSDDGSLVDIEVELQKLIDLRLTLVDDNGHLTDPEDNGHLIEIDAKILHLVKLNAFVGRRSTERRGENGALAQIAIEVKKLLDVQIDILKHYSGSQEDHEHLIAVSARIQYLLTVDVTVAQRGVQKRHDGAVVEVYIELQNLLDVEIELLGRTDLNDEEHEHLITVSAQIQHLLDLHLTVARREIAV